MRKFRGEDDGCTYCDFYEYAKKDHFCQRGKHMNYRKCGWYKIETDEKLSFEYLKKELIKFNAKSEFKQVAIVMLREIFENAEQPAEPKTHPYLKKYGFEVV